MINRKLDIVYDKTIFYPILSLIELLDTSHES